MVDDEVELITAASALSHHRLAPTTQPGVALVTAQAGPGLLVTDALYDAAVTLPELVASTRARLDGLLPPMTYQANPVDTGRPGPRHGDVLAAVAGDPAVDLVAVYGLAEPVVDLPAVVADSDLGAVPCIVGLDGLQREVSADQRTARKRGVLAVVGARALAVSVAALVTDSRQQAVLTCPEPSAPDSTAGQRAATCPPRSGWTEAAAKDVLANLGVRTPNRVVCAVDDAAVEAAESLGWPVALKISDAEVVHKSDRGGVHLGLDSREAVRRAITALREIGAREVLVEQMAAPGVDLVVGARRDPVFGPVVLVGIGGVATEVYADVALALAASPPSRFAAMTEELEARALLSGYRGGPTVDRLALGRVCAALGRLLIENDHLDEVDINPLRASSDGLIALDAVILGRAAPDLPADSTPTTEATS